MPPRMFSAVGVEKGNNNKSQYGHYLVAKTLVMVFVFIANLVLFREGRQEY
jgi:hypothetical protein